MDISKTLLQKALKATPSPMEQEALTDLNDLAWRLWMIRGRLQNIRQAYEGGGSEGLKAVARRARWLLDHVEFLGLQIEGLAREYAQQIILREEQREKERED